MEYQDYFGLAIAGEIVFGNGAVRYLPEIVKSKLKVQKVLLVSDQGVVRASHLEAVKAFAGPDYEVPVFEPEERRLLSRVEPIARHYDVRESPQV